MSGSSPTFTGHVKHLDSNREIGSKVQTDSVKIKGQTQGFSTGSGNKHSVKIKAEMVDGDMGPTM